MILRNLIHHNLLTDNFIKTIKIRQLEFNSFLHKKIFGHFMGQSM